MGQRLESFPAQCQEAWRQALALELPTHYRSVDRVAILGTGGSAIGGELLADLASLEAGPSIEVCRGYDLPSYIGKGTLVIASSNSGNTEETLSTFHQALSRGCKAIAVTSGGALLEEAQKSNVPVLTVKYRGEPRCALGYSFLVPLAVLTRLGLLSDKTKDVASSVGDLSRAVKECLGRFVSAEENVAQKLAAQLIGRLPVIYGAGIFRGAAHRWKTQLNENAKTWAMWDTLPDANHNSVVGYSRSEAIRDLSIVLLLKPGYIHKRLALRYAATGELLASQGVEYKTIDGMGSTPLGQILTTTLLGDFISYYLALLQGVDPSPVGPIEFIKTRLAKSGG